MKVSICMIVRNEEALLERAVTSARGLADEVVIVDTGSEDGTVDNARRLGAVVIEGGDRMNLGASRNMAQDAAQGDPLQEAAHWCVVLDADETIDDPVGVRKFLAETDAQAVYVQLVAGQFSWRQMRAWRRGTYRYKYRGHEVPLPVGEWGKIVMTEFVWRHHQPTNRWADKLPVTLERLRLDVQENPGEPRPVYYLGRQYCYLHEWQKALEWLAEYIRLDPHGIEVAEAYRFMAECYAAMGQKDRQLAELYRVCMTDPARRDYWAMLAEVYHYDGQHAVAYALLQAALALPQLSSGYTDDRWYGAHIQDLTARCLWYLGRREEGRPYAEEALRLAPEDARLRTNLEWFERAEKMM